MKWLSWFLISKTLVLSLSIFSCTSLLIQVPSFESEEFSSLTLQLELPKKYNHWRPGFESEWETLLRSFYFYADRFSPSSQGHCRVVVFENLVQAESFYKNYKLKGDPATPRAFPSLSLATIVLPINDRLLSGLNQPPQTLLHDFRHEVTHLLSAFATELLSSPLWFQEGFAEMLAPINHQDVHSWPHPHDVYMWWPDLEESMNEQVPSEVRYTWYAEKVRYLLEKFPGDKKPWLREEKLIVEKSTEPFLGLRGRHAFYDISNNHFLLASFPGSQVELDLPFIWDGRNRLEFNFRVGTASKSSAGIVLLNQFFSDENKSLVHIPCDGRGGTQLFLARSRGALALSYPKEEISFGEYSKFELMIENDSLKMKRGQMQKSIPLEGSGLSLPLRLRIYVSNGTFELSYEEILD